MPRIVIVSNRLPVSFVRKGKSFNLKPSVGGLSTGVGSLLQKSYEVVWVGWPGVAIEKITTPERDKIKKQLHDKNFYPVYLSQSNIDNFYSGFSNNTLWPLFHYFTQHVVYNKKTWNAYKQVNELFAQTVLNVVKPGDIIWVHDYHLMLLPGILREKSKDITLGFFLHIPFPSFDVFRLLPWRKEIMEGLLGSDLIGFHTYDYSRHFLSSLRNRLGYEHSLGRIQVGNRMVKVDTFPMGIDYDRFAQAAAHPGVKKEISKYKRKMGEQPNRKIILSVDRLDYTKGILERLHSYNLFLDKYPEYKDRIVLVLVAFPSRTKVEQYRNLKKELDELVGRINSKHGNIGWMPVLYLYTFLEFNALTALYIISDVGLVTPVRDGMNLIAKEFIATKNDGKGVLILSEMAGAAKEMSESIIVNPNNIERIADSIHRALTMPEEEQIKRNRLMQERLKRYNVEKWADDFIKTIESTKAHNQELLKRKINDTILQKIVHDYHKSKHRIIILDYDGTLRTFEKIPQDARPDEEIILLLQKLSSDSKNEVLIVSGRDKNTLGKWFKNVTVGMVAEHGVWIKEKNGIWELIEPLANYWKSDLQPILERYVDRTPGSFIEEKDYSLVWHYRKSDSELASIRARELKEAILHFTTNLGLGVLEGNKVIEIKNAGINKGHAALKWVANEYFDFILAAGDDRTDEDIFQVLPEHAYSIKIGLPPSVAKFCIDSVTDFRSLLTKLTV